MKILVIEDQERRFRYMITRLGQLLQLTNSGYEIVSFDQWRVGLDYYKIHYEEVALVILDIRMPSDPAVKELNSLFDKYTGIYVHSQMILIKPSQRFLFWTVLSVDELKSEGIAITDCNYANKLAEIGDMCAKIDENIGTKLVQFIERHYYTE